MSIPVGPAAQHHPGQHRAQDDVQPEPLGRHQQQEQQDDGPAQGRLRGRPPALPDDRADPRGADDPRQQGQQDGHDAHGQDRGDRDELAAPGEKQRDGHDGEELPDGPGGQDVPAEVTGQHVVVVQDGQQRAQRGRGQGQPDRYEGTQESEGAEDGHGAHRDDGADQPADDGQPARVRAQQPRVELVPGEQEQEPQPDVGEQLDAGGVGQAQAMRADQDAGQDQDDHLGYARPGNRGDDHRCQRRHQRHHQQ